MVILENYWNKFFSTCTNMVSICVKCMLFKGHAIQAAGESDVQLRVFVSYNVRLTFADVTSKVINCDNNRSHG